MTFVVSLREARRWKRLWPLWSPQQRGRRSSFVGLLNLGINSCVPRACCCDLCYHICSCWFSFSPKLLLGFVLDLQSGGISASKEQPQRFTLPLVSRVVSYQIHKVQFGLDWVVHVGVRTTNYLHRNFWFWSKLSEVSAVAGILIWVCVEIFRYAYSALSLDIV